MDQIAIPITPVENLRERELQQPKGRRVEPEALAQVCELLSGASRRPDMLIEHLHRIQDRFGSLSVAHLAALAQERRC
jgi:formate dehydrogenase beta subunit